MKLLSVQLARSIWLCHTDDFNPKGRSLGHIIIPLLVDLYKFKNFPSTKDMLDEAKGIKFEGGQFQTKDDEVITLNFTLFKDGLVVDTQSSTTHSDDFLIDILTRFHDDLKLPHFEQIIRGKNYNSQLYVSTDKSLELINPKLKEISNYLSEHVVGHGKVSYEVGGLAFWPDQLKAINPSPFSLERQINVPFSEKRYYSASALQTEKHFELLVKLENILGG